MKYVHSIYSVYVALALLVVVIVGGSFYITSIRHDLALDQTVDLSREIEEAFGNFVVYKNESFGYSFEYPKTWVLDFSNPEHVVVSVSGEGTKTIYIDHPYPDGILEGQEFLAWAKTQEWPFAPTTVEDYFDEVITPNKLKTYKRANVDKIHTVIVPVHNEILYVKRVDGEGDGTYEGEDVYFHLLNSFSLIF